MPNEIGGFEHKFVQNTHDRFICKICRHPCRDPYLSVCCGHSFCKSCIYDVKKTTNTCPCCRKIDFFIVENKQADREIRSFQVFCSNEERGCEWQGELNDIKNHLGNSDGCQFEDVKCSNKCGKMLQRRYLTGHVETECPCRKVDCQYCHITGEHQFIEGEHNEQCLKLPLPCPNKCEVGSVPREDMEAHRKECPLEMVLCEYHNVGCEDSMIRKRKMEHEEENMEEHLLMTKLKLAKTEDKLSATEAKVSLSCNRLGNLEVMVHRLISTTGSVNKLIEPPQWSSHLTTMATRVAEGTQICPAVVKLSKYTENKVRKVNWLSDPFFSNNKGYRMCLSIYVSGNSLSKFKDTHLSVFLCLMKGPHDDKLRWPMRGKFEVKLLNQISDCEHYSMMVNYDDYEDIILHDAFLRAYDDDCTFGWGYSNFISNEDLHMVTPTCQYLKDDCIFLQVSKL